jgi:RNA polymerase sigma-70 factor (ECF subfamily)
VVRNVSESRLIQLAQRYDAEALTELYRRHAHAIFRYVYHRVGDRESAEDLVGDVFVRAIEALPAYQDTGRPFTAWLYRIAHARVIDHYRRQQVRRTSRLNEALLADLDTDPALLAGKREDARRLWELLPRLTEEQQEVLSLRFIAGLNTAEVADALDKTEGAVRALQHRALSALRRLLETDS